MVVRRECSVIEESESLNLYLDDVLRGVSTKKRPSLILEEPLDLETSYSPVYIRPPKRCKKDQILKPPYANPSPVTDTYYSPVHKGPKKCKKT